MDRQVADHDLRIAQLIDGAHVVVAGALVGVAGAALALADGDADRNADADFEVLKKTNRELKLRRDRVIDGKCPAIGDEEAGRGIRLAGVELHVKRLKRPGADQAQRKL